MGTCLRAVEIVGYERYSSESRSIRLSSLNHLENISELKIEHVDMFEIKLINDLTNLKVLHLKNINIRIGPNDEFSHPLLEELDISNQFLSSMLNQFSADKVAETLVKNLYGCTSLRKLSLRGRYVFIDTLCNSLKACQQLRHLDATIKEKASSTYAIGHLVSTLGHSLEELHIDMYTNLDGSMTRSDWQGCVWNNLKIVSMQSTDIRIHTLLSCLNDRFPMLQVVNVERCRELPRGCKKTWRDIPFFKGVLAKSLRGLEG